MKFNIGSIADKVYSALPNGVSQKLGKAALSVKSNSPAILLGVGVVGFGATVYSASRATLKLQDILEEHEENERNAADLFAQERKDYTQDDYNKDRFYIWSRSAVAILKLYAPAAGLAAISLAAFGGSHVILNRRNAALASAYAAVEKAYDKYRQRVISEYGEDKDKEFRFNTVEKDVKGEDGKKTKQKVATAKDPHMYARVFDSGNRNWSNNPTENRIFLRLQQNWANDKLVARGHVFLNEVYDCLGLERTKAGSVVGWTLSEDGTDNFIDFGCFEDSLEDFSTLNFIDGNEDKGVLLDFNVNGVIYDKLKD